MRTLLVVLGCLLLAACGGSAEEGHLTLKLDGKPMAFNERLKAQMGGDREHLVIGGHLPDSPDSNDIELWSLGKRIEPGTYSLPAAKLISRYAIQSKGDKSRGTTIWSRKCVPPAPGSR